MTRNQTAHMARFVLLMPHPIDHSAPRVGEMTFARRHLVEIYSSSKPNPERATRWLCEYCFSRSRAFDACGPSGLLHSAACRATYQTLVMHSPTDPMTRGDVPVHCVRALQQRLAKASGVRTAAMSTPNMSIEGQKPSQSRVNDAPIMATQKSQKVAHKSRFILGMWFILCTISSLSPYLLPS